MKCYDVLKCHSIWVNAESVKQHHSEERGSVCCRCSNPLCPNITHAAAFLGGWGDAVYNYLHLCVIWKPSVWKSKQQWLILDSYPELCYNAWLSLPKVYQIFVSRREKKEKEKEEYICRRKYLVGKGEEEWRRKGRKIFGELNHFVCGKEEVRRRKRRKIFEERFHWSAEERKTVKGSKKIFRLRRRGNLKKNK